MASTFGFPLVVAALLGLGQAPDPAKEAPGLKVGDKAPAFSLKDQDGRERTLDELLKGGKVALVFTRSADW